MSFKNNYPSEELSRLDSVTNLFSEWEKELSKSKNPVVRKESEDMVCDGFYPFYDKQPRKILFIGREAYGLKGHNYLEVFHKVYRIEKKIGDTKHLNQHFFHARMLHIAWGILNGMPDWEDIPWADKIGDDFASVNGISFAFMNLCKLSNESGGINTNFSVMDVFCRLFR